MDGPAFHVARDGVEQLKESGYLFNVSGEGIPNLSLLRETLSLVSHTMTKWPRTRFQTLAMMQAGNSVKEVAARLDLSDQAVYRTIDAGALDVVTQLFNETQAILNTR